MEPSLMLGVLAAAGACFGAYAAIRADLAKLHERSNQALELAKKAHERIDEMGAGRRVSRPA